MWQKCPICNGTGVDQQNSTPNKMATCPTCNGKRIISEVSGLPPIYPIEREEAERKQRYDMQKTVDKINKELGFDKYSEPSIEGDAKITLK